MNPVAIGMRAHSGWAALVAVAGSPNSPIVLDRRRIEIADRTIPGTIQPYHAAAKMSFPKAEKFVEHCAQSSRSLACEALEKTLARLRAEGHSVIASGLLLGSGRLAPSLEAILASHPALHTAEGEMFRGALRHASEQCGLRCAGVREKDLVARAETVLGIPAESFNKRLSEIGKPLGSPWRQDEKYAAIAGWLALISN